MKVLLNKAIALLLLGILAACERYADDYKDYLNNQEIVYPGLARNVRYYAGDLRTMLVWNPSPDPNIDHYIVRWNNGINSMEVEATTHDPGDSISVVIPDLNEYVYSFTITAYDTEGNTSVGQELNNVRVYGSTYRSLLLNRGYNVSHLYDELENGDIILHFNRRDTLSAGTEIVYTDNSNQERTVELLADTNDVLLPDFKFGSAVRYRTGYIPEWGAIDTFFAESYDELPTIYRSVLADKSLFQPMNLPGDIGSAWGWEMPYLWDGVSDVDFGFHTADQDYPLSFTIDMGQSATLTRMKLWQRISGLYNYGNPKRFEVYGSNTPPGEDGNWAAWTLLGTFTSTKPSGTDRGIVTDEDRIFAEAGENFTFPAGIPEVRYIRFKILEPWGDGGTRYFHAQEISLYRQQR
ncbi:DUF4998 domain-containing protein [Parapedobacter defluvii]|uniref:DUF4998 domain-containing protein n=1 Tax=Parapedobacter defluvii TaxID=2045106 RepID=UPI000FA2C144|nr:MAG: hypothetical protein EAS52_26245 [Parapedobacter sp.]